MLHLRLLTQRLKDTGHASALPVRLQQLLADIVGDGRDDDGGDGGGLGLGSIAVRRVDAETMSIALQRDWGQRNEKRDLYPDAERRLCYVAMTRARQTLPLARLVGE